MNCVDVDIDLDASLYPSFASSLFEPLEPGVWVKRVGFGRFKLFQREGRVCCKGLGCTRRVLWSLTGLWCLEKCRRVLEEKDHMLPSGVRELAWRLTVSALPEDRESIAIAVFLSRRTSYVSNVVRWVQTILVEAADPATGMVDTGKVREAAELFTSYQVRQLKTYVDKLVEVARRLTALNLLEARRKLLSIPFIGPKAADAIILFTGVSTRVAPYDTHLSKLLRDMGLPHKPPSKTVCRRHLDCNSCPFRGKCGSGLLVEMFGEAAGLVQTASYVYYSLGGRIERLKAILEKWGGRSRPAPRERRRA